MTAVGTNYHINMEDSLDAFIKGNMPFRPSSIDRNSIPVKKSQEASTDEAPFELAHK